MLILGEQAALRAHGAVQQRDRSGLNDDGFCLQMLYFVFQMMNLTVPPRCLTIGEVRYSPLLARGDGHRRIDWAQVLHSKRWPFIDFISKNEEFLTQKMMN